ncbi:hypothetical protein WEU32_06820 [Brevundimonas sp. BH3]|uniref:hypothetical protein n=1 Tax=Brevundimonas sp. BH3 TaxID=3133089 RepID=UPI00324EF234
MAKHRYYKHRMAQIVSDATKSVGLAIIQAFEETRAVGYFDGDRMVMTVATKADEAIRPWLVEFRTEYVFEANRFPFRKVKYLQDIAQKSQRQIFEVTKNILPSDMQEDFDRNLYAEFIEKSSVSAASHLDTYFNRVELMPWYKRLSLLSGLIWLIVGSAITKLIDLL